jgi:hypothetical protein
MSGFPEKYIYFREFNKRKQASKENFPRKFSGVTLILDGKHTKLDVSWRHGEKLFNNELQIGLFTLMHYCSDTLIAMKRKLQKLNTVH